MESITQLSIMGAIIKLDGWSADRQDGKTICRSSEEQELEQIQRMNCQPVAIVRISASEKHDHSHRKLKWV